MFKVRTRADPMLHRKTKFARVQFRQGEEFPATRRRLFDAISVEPNRRDLSLNYAVRFCEIRAASQRTSEERITSSTARGMRWGANFLDEPRESWPQRETRLLVRLGCLSRPLSPLFGSLREAFVILGDPQHRVLGIQVVHLLGDGARLFCALAPMRGVVDEGCRHLSALGGPWPALAYCVTLRGGQH